MNAGEIGSAIVAKSFGRVLRAYRSRSAISQERLAEAVGMDRTYISMLERGIHQPTLTVVLRLAVVLDVSPAELVEAVQADLDRDDRHDEKEP